MSIRQLRHREHETERGGALLFAVFVTLIVSLLALGLLGRTLLVSRLAAVERGSVKAFYAADSGLNFAQTRARINQLTAFTMILKDTHGVSNPMSGNNIDVAVDELQRAGAPRLVIGSEANAGQGADPVLVIESYRTASDARHEKSRSERRIEVVFGVGPKPASIE
jgi:hypothetical protein